MFTDRFIKVPVEMYDKKQAELTGNDNESIFGSYMKINPLEICSYRVSHDEDCNEEDKTIIEFRNGNNITVLMSITNFEQLVNGTF